MTIQCMDDVLEKIKNKDFEIDYKEAIDLWKLFKDFNESLDYVWIETMGSKVSKLMYVKIGFLSDVKLHVKN